MSNWSQFPLAIASEVSGGRHWLGTMELAAVYCKALSATEVQQNFDAGPDGNISPPGPLPSCNLAPATSTIVENSSHTVTSTVSLDSQPVAGVLVSFLVDSGPNVGKTGTDTTDVNGQVTFTYTGDQGLGTDHIKASGTVQSDFFECSAQVDWVAAPVPQCTLAPASASLIENNSHTVVSTVTLNGQPVAGVLVTFMVDAGPNIGKTGMDTTDASGQASFTYLGNNGLGADNINASGTHQGEFFECDAQVDWNAAPVPQCALAPFSASEALDGTHAVVSTVTLDGQPVSGVLVTFLVDGGPNLGETGTDTTDVNGQASFMYVGTGGLGTDNINASGTFMSDFFECNAHVQWTQPSARVGDSLVALYTFDEGSGTTVGDSSGFGTPLDLTIEDPANVTWGSGTLRIDSTAVIASPGNATKLIDEMVANNAFTFEAWVRPASVSLSGALRIITISQNSTTRNAALNQVKTKLQSRVRNTGTDLKGQPYFTSSQFLTTDLTHIVFTRSSNGVERYFINGALLASRTRVGNLSQWSQFPLGLAAEVTGGFGWRGDYHLVAIYAKDLTTAEVLQNFDAGADPLSGGGGELLLPGFVMGSPPAKRDVLDLGRSLVRHLGLTEAQASINGDGSSHALGWPMLSFAAPAIDPELSIREFLLTDSGPSAYLGNKR